MKKLTFLLSLAIILNSGIIINTQKSTNNSSVYAKTFKASAYKYSTKGEKMIEEGDLDKAEDYYRKLLRWNPRNLDARVGLASVFSAKYQLGTAEKEFKNILKVKPDHPGAHNGLGLVYYRKTTSSNQEIRNQIPALYNQAIEEFKTALKYAPNYAEAHNNLGKIYLEQGRIEEAESSFNQAIDIDNTYSEAITNLGTIYYNRGEIDAAIDKYKEAIKFNSKNSTAHYRLTRKGKYSEAIQSLQTSKYLYPNSAPVHDKLGEVYELQGNEAAAINEYRKAITIKPEYLPSYIKLSSIFEYRGDDELAVSELRSALDVNSDFSEAKLKIAEISTRIGKESQAIKLYQEVLKDEPENANALKGISQAYFNRAKKESMGGLISSHGDYVDAEIAVRQALRTSPDDLELHLALIRLSQLSGKPDVSKQELSAIASRQPRTPAESIIKGEALYSLGHFSEGSQEFQKALKYTNQIKDVLLLGDIFSVNGDLKMANVAYQKAHSIEPKNLKAIKGIDRVKQLNESSRQHYRQGLAFFKERQRPAAIDSLRKAAAINSVEPMTRWLLAEAYRKEDFIVDAIFEYNAFIELADPVENEKLVKKASKISEKLTSKMQSMLDDQKELKIYGFQPPER